jgi:hypothetical protein
VNRRSSKSGAGATPWATRVVRKGLRTGIPCK